MIKNTRAQKTLEDVHLLPSAGDDGRSISGAQRWRRPLSYLILFGAAVSVVLTFAISTVYNAAKPGVGGLGDAKVARRPCGYTAADAQRRGCVFDLPNFAWLPEDCVDHDLSRSFMEEQGEWEFFRDRNKTARVTIDEVSLGTWEYFINGRVHVAHCSFSWLHFHKALAMGHKIHGQHNLEHTTHCTHVLTKARPYPEDVEIRVKIAFPDCGYIDRDYPG
ncbi:hypothetical protein MCOR25_007660 [Pyricularia grisea]|uniref:Uncharacterized protein n=1 Tax=Pyricularia grisea TaxID=148305 RepID=A0A6P8B2Z5_PYRGI|nr:uncharacterized protein PgNI_06755 [Pyricularia grisea]KAI6357446.1 hypothetical protein MCOR25_007660 [Pyricularia grisea]TLD09222.1 hypothetical protein PgNI_06755 [Pyricularia grisea]